MVHGGGFVSGAGAYYDASAMARKTDAVVVTINHRLGPLGFLTTSGMTAENKAVNFGLQDQYEALHWVKGNIAAFGGDPGRVTLAGQSAGAASGCLALVSPKAAGLINRIIMHSAPCSIAAVPLTKATSNGDAMAAKLGCPAGPNQMACLRTKPVTELLTTLVSPPEEALASAIWPATVDGEVIPAPVLSALSWGQFNRVPVMLGSTSDEGRGLVGWGLKAAIDHDLTQADYTTLLQHFAGDVAGSLVTELYPTSKYGSPGRALAAALTDIALACPTDAMAKSLSDHVSTYAFEFADRQAPPFFPDPYMPEGWGAYHGGDLLYLFQRPVNGLNMPGLNASQTALSDQMLAYWKRFAATGNPNAAQPQPPAVNWPKFDRLSTPFLSLQPVGMVTQTYGKFQNAHQCLTWSSLYGTGALFGIL